MDLIKEARRMQDWAGEERARGRRIGLAPTMGFLHQGHLSLVEYVRQHCDRVVVSIFVNPMQFGPSEDLAQYPRDLERDLGLLRPLGVDVVFHPEAGDMYPEGFQTRVEVTEVTQELCGAFRPGHFCGVATVVLKLFNLVQPHLAVFGEKDYQQLVTIQRMARDLNLDLEVVGRPTVREPDGLALSSRNMYLKPEERPGALSLYGALNLAREMAAAGERDAAVILKAVRGHIEAKPHTRLQYAQIVHPRTITPVSRLEGEAVLALAVFVGRTRLIDNMLIKAG
ncbi:MAG: pantoate--beta-alanine ligase [Thermodesulfobacteriota bacterium]